MFMCVLKITNISMPRNSEVLEIYVR